MNAELESPSSLRFWFTNEEIHLAPLAREISIQTQSSVVMTVRHPLPEERRSLGWSTPDWGQARIETVTSWDAWDGDPREAFHIISNPFQDPQTRRLISRLHKHGANYAFECAQPGAHSGPLGAMLRRMAVWALARRPEYRAARFLLGHGKAACRTLTDCGFKGSKVHPWGYWLDEANPTLPSPDPTPQPILRLVYLGQLIQRKGLDILFNALARVPMHITWKLHCIGTGSEESSLKSLAASLGIDRHIVFGKPLAQKDVEAALRNFDVLVLPSRHEEWGCTINEGIRSGLAIICSSHCGAQDLVEPSLNGLIIPNNNIQAWVDAITAAPQHIEAWKDKARRQADLITARTKAVELMHLIQQHQAPGANSVDAMRINISYHFLAHYRRGVFQNLLDAPDHLVQFYADPSSAQIDGSIAPWDGCPAERLTPCRIRRIPGLGYIQWKTLWEILRTPKSHWVFLGDTHALHVWIGSVLARLRGHHVSFWAHGWLKKESWIKGQIRKLFFTLPHKVLLYGRRAKNLAIDEGLPEHKLHVIYNSLDTEEQRKAKVSITLESIQAFRNAHGITDDRPILICTSRLTRARRLDLLLQAVATLPERPRILLVGDGPERGSLEKLAKELKVAVHFLGEIYDETLIAHAYAMSMVTVAPGKVGLTAMHSLGYGVPVLTHDNADEQMPEWEAIVPGLTGDLFKADDLDDMRLCIQRWLNKEDRAIIQEACRTVIDRFYTPEAQVREMVKALSGQSPITHLGDRIQASELPCH